MERCGSEGGPQRENELSIGSAHRRSRDGSMEENREGQRRSKLRYKPRTPPSDPLIEKQRVELRTGCLPAIDDQVIEIDDGLPACSITIHLEVGQQRRRPSQCKR